MALLFSWFLGCVADRLIFDEVPAVSDSLIISRVACLWYLMLCTLCLWKKYEFCTLQGIVATALRWDRQNCSQLCQVTSRCCVPKNHSNWPVFYRVTLKIMLPQLVKITHSVRMFDNAVSTWTLNSGSTWCYKNYWCSIHNFYVAVNQTAVFDYQNCSLTWHFSSKAHNWFNTK